MKRYLAFALLLALLTPLAGLYYGQNKVQTKKAEWSVIQTKHFDIYYPKDAEESGRLPRSWPKTPTTISKKTSTSHAQPHPVIFYESKSAFQSTNIILSLLSEGVGGFTEYQKNRVVVPFDGSYYNLEEVLTHELTHAYVNAVGSPGQLADMSTFSFPSGSRRVCRSSRPWADAATITTCSCWT
jgi:hypothetical protein